MNIWNIFLSIVPKRTACMMFRLLLLVAALFVLSGCSDLVKPPALSEAQKSELSAMIQELTITSLENSLQSINMPRQAGTASADAAELVLTNRLTSEGYSVQLQATGSDAGWPPEMNTIMVDKTGIDPNLPKVYLTAHWDSYGSGNGMDDNGSGVAAILETARIIRSRQFKHTIRFILFANEELNISGSKTYFQQLSAQDRPRFFINYDSIGYTKQTPDEYSFFLGQTAGDYIAVFAPEWASFGLATFSDTALNLTPGLKFSAVAVPSQYKHDLLLNSPILSDHHIFWENQIPGLLITDLPTLRNPHYHQDDHFATLDLGFIQKAAQASLATIAIEAGLVAP